MPATRTPTNSKAEQRERDRRVAQALRERKEFAAGFTRSAKGNAWREVDGGRVVVYRTRFGYRWMFCPTGGEPEYDADAYPTEQEAVDACWWCLFRPPV